MMSKKYVITDSFFIRELLDIPVLCVDAGPLSTD
jgi:hypothetical protein